MKSLLILALVILTSYFVRTQNAYQPELGNQDYNGVINKAQNVLEKNNTDSIAWYYLGLSYTKLHEPQKAIEYLSKAKNNGLNIFPVQLNLAKNYTAIQEFDKALAELQEGANAGSTAYNQLDSEEFDALKEMETFKDIREQMYLTAFPCKGDENYRKFDFWLGEWDVFAANGHGPKIAESTISLTHGDCGILEDYRPIGQAGGNSISYYDKNIDKWKQNWVSNGSVSHYVEPDSSSDCDMALIAASHTPQGLPSLLRMRYFKNEDGSVRQLMDSSLDDGKSWGVVFDGLYKKKSMEITKN